MPIELGELVTVTKELIKGLEDLEIRGLVETIQMTALLKIIQETEKSSGDMRRLAVSQTPVEDHQLTLIRKTLKGMK